MNICKNLRDFVNSLDLSELATESPLQKVARTWADTDPGKHWWSQWVTENHRELAQIVTEAVDHMDISTDPKTQREATAMLTLLVYDHYLESNADQSAIGGEFPPGEWDDGAPPDDWGDVPYDICH